MERNLQISDKSARIKNIDTKYSSSYFLHVTIWIIANNIVQLYCTYIFKQIFALLHVVLEY